MTVGPFLSALLNLETSIHEQMGDTTTLKVEVEELMPSGSLPMTAGARCV